MLTALHALDRAAGETLEDSPGEALAVQRHKGVVDPESWTHFSGYSVIARDMQHARNG